MRLFIITVLLLLPFRLIAQQINGVVLDKITGQPIAYATIAGANSIISTTQNGKFTLNNINPGDSITVTCIGYRSYKMGYNLSTSQSLIIYMQQQSILLQDVVVKVKHDPKLDSIRVRKQFASVFEYKKPTFKDMFITVDPYYYVPYNYIDAPNSTASLVSINLLSVVSLLSKNKNITSKLQQTLLKNEEDDYVDRVFSKQKITSITKLKGDSLIAFMANYRPAIKQAKKMSDYEMVLYIKDSYAEFIRNYNAKENSLLGK